jgi:L,D-peptidoglycan transpeptidase YkuD (ErfK/YbiS/YcfS/YnhG family)
VRFPRASVVAFLLLSSPARAETVTTTGTPVSPVTSTNRQLILVHSLSWFASGGTLERYERRVEDRWSRVGTSIEVSLGRHGMAWGRGLHEPPDHGPMKKDGDGRSPAGVFALTRAFGASETLPDGAHDFPYQRALPSNYCVEDVHSDFYNQIIDVREVNPRSWEKWSELRRPDGLFDWAIVVLQNAPDVRRGAGSCVFLHIWRGANVPTAGCTAMPREHIEAILRWLESDEQPVLVQLPDPELAEWRARFDLPR